MKRCEKCGQEWADSFHYCPNDATPLQEAPPDPLVGQLLGNKYEILNPLGRGPHGVVYRAHHRVADRPCAVKLLRTELTQQDGQLQQLRTVIRVGLELRSPYTVRLYDFDHAEGVGYFLVEEMVEGDSLHTLLNNRGRLPPPLCAALLGQISESLAEAHARGLGHSHLTTANVLLTGTFPELTAKVSDYGLSRLTCTLEDAPCPDTDTDLLSLGGLLFHILTGEEPSTTAGESTHELRTPEELKVALQRAEVPQRLHELAIGLLGLDPGRRFGSAAEVTTAVSGLLPSALLKPESPPAAPLDVEPGECAAVPSQWAPTPSPSAESEPLPPLEEPRLSLLRVGIFLGLVALVGVIVVWLWSGKPAPPSQTAAAPAPKEVASTPLPVFDYEITQRANEGDPVEHPHVLVRVGRLPLYIIRSKGSYPSTVDRARAATEALDRAAANLRGNPNLRFTLARRDGNPTIVQGDSVGTDQLSIIAVTRADVYAYNARSHETTTQGELAQWWLARTRDYVGLFVLGRTPRLTTRTEDGAALVRLYALARTRSAGTREPAPVALQRALSELDPNFRKVLQSGVFQFPERHSE
jgi:serine/threonine-protein kinase